MLVLDGRVAIIQTGIELHGCRDELVDGKTEVILPLYLGHVQVAVPEHTRTPVDILADRPVVVHRDIRTKGVARMMTCLDTIPRSQ